MTRFLQAYLPHIWLARVEDISCELLVQFGISGILLDVDNTLVHWHDDTVRPEVLTWILKLKAADITICLVSNTVRGKRLKQIAEVLDVDYVACGVIPYSITKHPVFGAKPHRSAFQKGLTKLGLSADQVAMAGDQVFTDIRGAKRSRLKLTILITPSSKREHWGTKLKRHPERAILWMYRKAKWLNHPGVPH
jgi:HAD superfamily phosphatase (TIGR01668 family)